MASNVNVFYSTEDNKYHVIDKQLLNDERKERRRIKKELGKQKNQKEREQEHLLKLQPKDQHLNIISESQLDNIINKKSTVEPNRYLKKSFQVQSSEFPQLGEHIPKKVHSVPLKLTENVSTDVTHHNVSRKKSKKPLQINIEEALHATNFVPLKDKDNVKVHSTETLSGNLLDSDNPVRKSGKHREVPKKKTFTKLKKAIIKERQQKETDNDTTEIKTESISKSYCNNIILPELTTAIEALLTDLVFYQNRLYKQDPLKGVQKRKYIVGFHSVEKYIPTSRLKLIVIAPNLQESDVLREKVQLITTNSDLHKIPYVFASNRRKLGKITLKNVPVSCIGILNYSGAEQIFQKVIELIQQSKEEFVKSSTENVEINTVKLIDVLNEVL